MYQLARGFIQRCSHGRFMIMGARDGADMFAVFDGRVRVVEVRRAGNGGVKIPGVRELVIHFRELELAATQRTGLALGGLPRWWQVLGWAGGCGCPRLSHLI